MELRRHTLLDAVTSAGKSERLFVGDLMNRIGLHVQIDATATVKWYASNLADPDVNTAGDWVELNESTVSEIAYSDGPLAWVHVDATATTGAVTAVLLGNSF